MKYTRKLTPKDIMTRVLNFNQKALPDPNAKYTTMDKFMKSYNIKSRLMKLGNNAFRFLDTLSVKKDKVLSKPTIYSETSGYKDTDQDKNAQKKDNLVIPLLDDDN